MRQKLLLILAVAVTAIVIFPPQLPLGIPGEWSWPRQQLPQTLPELLDRFLSPLLLSAAMVAMARFADCRMERWSGMVRGLALLALVLFSFCWQNVVRQSASSPHREIRPLWVLYYRVATGYFAEAAFRTPSTADFLRTYEARVARGDVLHEGTHPPGLYLLSLASLEVTSRSQVVADLALRTQPESERNAFRELEARARLERPMTEREMAGLCLLVWLSTLAAAAAVLPVYVLMRPLTGVRAAWRASCLVMTIPAVAMFTPRSDVLYLLTAAGILCCAVQAVLASGLTRQLAWSLAGGGLTFVGLLLSLAHLPVVLAAGVFGLLAGLSQGRTGWRRAGIVAGAASLTLVIGCGLWKLLTGSSLLTIWQGNLRNHAAFYQQSPRTVWLWALVNPLELALAAGLPVALMALTGLWNRFTSTSWIPWRGTTVSDRRWHLAASLMVAWGLLWLSGRNAGEAARLWCFLTPWVILTAVLLQSSEWEQENSHCSTGGGCENAQSGWLWLLACQLLVCLLTTSRVSGFLEF